MTAPAPSPSCILVGNGSSLLDSEQGPQIDAHEVVVRFNHCLLAGFEKHTGTRTDTYCSVMNYYQPRMETLKPCTRVIVHSWQWDPARCKTFASFSHLPRVDKIPHSVLKEARAYGPKGYDWYSTGALAAWFLLREFPVLTLTGFDWWDPTRKDKPHHYCDRAPRGPTHRPDKEWEFFSKLAADGKVKFLTPP